MALGRSYVALGDDASSVLWNAAALSQLPQSEITFLHAALFEGTRYNFIGYAHVDRALDPWAFGAGLAQMYLSGFVKRDATNTVTGEFSDSQTAAFVSASFAPVRGLPLGVGTTVKMLSKQLDTLNASGFAVDVSGYWSLADIIAFGVNGQNLLASGLQRGEGTEQLPVSLLAGGTVWLLDRSLVGTVMMEKIGAGSWAIHAGAEYNLLSSIQIRGGWDQGYPTGGVGISMDGWALDYAVLSHPDLGLSHRASVSYRFGMTRKQVEAVEQERAERIKRWLADGTSFIAQKRWSEAIKALRGILDLEEHHSVARQALADIRKELAGSDPRVAAGQFRREGGSAWVVNTLNKHFSKELAGVSRLPVLDPSLVEAALKDKGMEKSGCSTPEAAAEIGKALKVAWVVIGLVKAEDQTFRITANVVAVQTGDIIASKTVTYQSSDDLDAAMRDLAGDLMRELGP